jgi:hypothetical protein
MQPEARQPTTLELADRRLVDASQALHSPLSQSGLESPITPLGPDPTELLVDLRRTRSYLAVHAAYSTGGWLLVTQRNLHWRLARTGLRG